VTAPEVARDEATSRPGAARRLAVGLTVLGGSLLLGGCSAPTFGEFRGATTQGKDEFKLWVGMFAAGLVVAGIVWALIFWAVIRYRRKGDEIPRQFREHIPLEISYTIVPFVIVIAIFVATVYTENNVDAVAAHPNDVVDVTAFQWGWKFQYQAPGSDAPTACPAVPSGIVASVITSEQQALAQLAGPPSDPAYGYPQMVLPLGESTEIVLQSNDVAHSLWVPAFNFSRMALPGVCNTFEFTPTETGVFDGRCNQYCGLYHSEMLFSVKVVTPSQFQTWLQTQQTTQETTTTSPSPTQTPTANTGLGGNT
jgi:cytochrome c oxidase subunit 2